VEPSDRTIRQQQWHEAIDKVNELKGSLPVISVGDYNIQKHDDMACDMLPLQQSSGVGDILSQKCNTNAVSGWRAQHLIDAWVNSNDKWIRDITQWSTYYNHQNYIGNNIDWIFASNNLAVPEYQLVCNFNHSTLQMSGLIPSDHNMIRATITIP
jgi:exonuclease III